MTERAQRLERWERWLASRSEPAIDPSLLLVDPHHHLWDRGGHQYLIEDYRRDAAGHRVTASVYVECLWNYKDSGPDALKPVGETEHVREMADESPAAFDTPDVAAGIVGFADLSLGAEVGEVLDAHRAAAGSRFKGIRYPIAFDAELAMHRGHHTIPNMIAQPGVLAAARQLVSRRLSLDLWLFFHQLAETSAFAKQCPELTIVINHLGGPLGIGVYAARRSQVFDAWRASIAVFRDLPHVVMKFGGLAMPLAGFGLREQAMPPTSLELAAAWRPYFEVCLEVFGPQRLMFESNFPVDRSGSSFGVLWNAFKRLAAGLSSGERAALFSQNAQSVYRLADPARLNLRDQPTG